MVRRPALLVTVLAVTMGGCALTPKLGAVTDSPTSVAASPTAAGPSPSPSPSPTATPKPVDVTLPAKLPNGWVRYTEMDKVTAGIVAYFNQENPGADLRGGTYFPPRTANPSSGSMLFVAGPGDVDEEELLQLLDGGVTSVQDHTLCARGASAKDRILVCSTRQAPTVIVRTQDSKAYDEKALARFVSDYQARLNHQR